MVTSALGLVQTFVNLIGSISVSSNVLVTVLWYDSKNPSAPAGTKPWAPLHVMYDGWRMRAIHYRWNPGWAMPQRRSYPFVYSSTLKRKGWDITDVAHEPWELAQAFYPLGHWPPPAPAAAPAGTMVCHRERDWSVPADAPYTEKWTTVCEPAPAGPARVFADHDPAVLPAEDGAVVLDEPDGVEDGRWERVRLLTAGTETPPADTDVSAETAPEAAAAGVSAITAHLMPRRGGEPLGVGRVEDDQWIPSADVEPRVPPMIWLPHLERVAEFDGQTQTWALAAQLSVPFTEGTRQDDTTGDQPTEEGATP